MGRKEGLCKKPSIPAEMFKTIYVVKKNMVSTGAIIFKSPMQTVAIATPKVTAVPIRGSSLGLLPLPRKDNQRGKTLSLARACKTLGAPKILPMALERVAPQTPNKIAGPQKAISFIIKGFSIKVVGSARMASTIGNTI